MSLREMISCVTCQVQSHFLSAGQARDGARIRTIIVQTLHNNLKISGHAIYNAAPFSIQRSFRGQPLHYLIKWIWLSTCTLTHFSHITCFMWQVSRVGIIITDNVTQCSDDHRMTDHQPGSQDSLPHIVQDAGKLLLTTALTVTRPCAFCYGLCFVWNNVVRPEFCPQLRLPGAENWLEEDAEWTSVTGHWIMIKTQRLHVIPSTPARQFI